MLCAFLSVSATTKCSTQARLAEKMQLSRSQVNNYVKQFGKRFSFVSNSTYSQHQRECCKERGSGSDQRTGPSGGGIVKLPFYGRFFRRQRPFETRFSFNRVQS